MGRLSGILALVLIALVAVRARATDFGKTPELVSLGRQLFYEKKLSAQGTISCASCHDPARFYTDGLQVAVGNAGRAGSRNTPTIGPSSDMLEQFHDGRTIGTPLQATQPLENVLEMADTGRVDGQGQPIAQTLEDVMERLRGDLFYVRMFAKAYPKEARTGNLQLLINPTTYGKAVAAFEERTKSRQAPIDKRLAGYTTAFLECEHVDAAQLERGYQLFVSSGCMNCHSGRDYTDGRYHNNGATFFVGETGRDSLGRFAIVSASLRKTADVRAFKTPTLRELALTAPYMHNGRVGTLAEVVEGYSAGWQIRGEADRFRDPLVRPLHLSDGQQADLVAFLEHGTKDPTEGWKITEPVRP